MFVTFEHRSKKNGLEGTPAHMRVKRFVYITRSYFGNLMSLATNEPKIQNCQEGSAVHEMIFCKIPKIYLKPFSLVCGTEGA